MVKVHIFPHDSWEGDLSVGTVSPCFDMKPPPNMSSEDRRNVFLLGGFLVRGSGMSFLSSALKEQCGANVHGVSLAELNVNDTASDATGCLELAELEFLKQWRSWQKLPQDEVCVSRNKRQHVKAVLVGMSLGAIVALLLSKRHPDKIEAVILISPAFRFTPCVVKLLGNIASVLSAYDDSDLVLASFPRAKHRYGRGKDKLCYLRLPLKMVPGLATLQEEALSLIRSGCKWPTLIIHNRHDKIAPFAPLKEVLGLGHFQEFPLSVKKDNSLNHVSVGRPEQSTAIPRIVRWLAKRVWNE